MCPSTDWWKHLAHQGPCKPGGLIRPGKNHWENSHRALLLKVPSLVLRHQSSRPFAVAQMDGPFSISEQTLLRCI